MAQYYDLRGELTLFGWWGLVLIYVAFGLLVVWFGSCHGAAARAWLAGWYRWTVALACVTAVYAVL